MTHIPRTRVLVTGAEGTIGTAVRQFLAHRYDLRSLTRAPAAFPSHAADIADLDAILPAFDGMDAVVHLAASPSVSTPWEDILPNNLVGTYNVFEAAARSGVSRVVYASSNHVIGMDEIQNAPGLYDLDDPRVFDERAELRPDSLYGVSKVFGEALARYYVERRGLTAVCLRIGTVQADDDPRSLDVPEPLEGLTPDERRRRIRATWLSRRDCAELIGRAIDAPVRWAVVYGISDNPRQFWSLGDARRLLGYEPRDAAPR
jgi:NAD+ dependent glucose-6-phosphate dehydrogenase